MKLVFAVTLMCLTYSDARTVEGRMVQGVEILKGHSQVMGRPMIVPRFKPGLNDIQTGLMDKADPRPHQVGLEEDVGLEIVSTTPYSPTIPEGSDVKTLEKKPAEVDEGGTTSATPAATEEDDLLSKPQADAAEEDLFDPTIFQKETDLVVVMKKMYESLTKRMHLLKGRVSSVEQTTTDILARLTDLDCSDLQRRGQKESGIHTLHMDHNGKRPVDVACDMVTDGGGWTVIQSRTSMSKNVDFNRSWFDYKMGFGNVSSDFWIGLENIYIWTNTRHYELRIDLTDFAGETSFAHYDHFYIESEDEGYRLHISGYSGTSGDSMGNEGKADNFTADGMMFSTYDQDHDTSHEINCAKYWKIGGWWFNRCSWANLNGPYREPGEGDGIGINWHMWRNKEYLRSSNIMIRPSRNN